MKYLKLIYIALFSVANLLHVHGELAAKEEIFADLKTNEFNSRVVDYWLNQHHYADDPLGSTSDAFYQKESKWIREQGQKVFPVLFEMFKREDDFFRKLRLLDRLQPQQDKTETIKKVRELVVSSKDGTLTTDHTSFLIQCFRYLAKSGSESDKALIQNYVGHADTRANLHAAYALANLEKRLTRERELKETRENRAQRVNPETPGRVENHTEKTGASPNVPRDTVTSNDKSSSSSPPKWWAYGLSGLFVVAGAAALIKMKSKPTVSAKNDINPD